MPGPVGGIDLDALVAIDVHTHAEVSAVTGRGSLTPELERAADEYFGIRDRQRPTVEQMAAYYRDRRMMAVVFTVDATTAMGVPPVPNDEIAEAAHAHPDVLIPFASVDPHLGRAAVREVHRLVGEHHVRGFKFHPTVQAFHPNDRMAYPVYEAVAEHGLIALTCPSCWRTRRSRGRTRRWQSPPTSRRFTSTCRVGRLGTSRPSWSTTPTRSWPTRCSSGRTFR
jgi:predicted TIM-barrel fold metal-dependent hydrolase